MALPHQKAGQAGNGQGDTLAGLSSNPLASTGTAGLVSILIPCCGQLEYTKLCVPSVVHHSRSPVELIFLDIGSLDGTADYLAGVAAAPKVRIEVVRTRTDLELPEVVQEALARARGEYLVLLNNDTVVTESWLERLVLLAKQAPNIGLVGPMSNYASPPQLIETVPYRLRAKKERRGSCRAGTHEPGLDVSAVHSFAKAVYEKNKDKWVSVERLGGFCLLLKREVLHKVGPLDTASGLEVFETALLCAKARQAGYTLGCCRDVFVHHFGTRTYAQGGPTSAQQQ